MMWVLTESKNIINMDDIWEIYIILFLGFVFMMLSVSRLCYVASDDITVNEWWIWMDLEVCRYGLIELLVWNVLALTDDNYICSQESQFPGLDSNQVPNDYEYRYRVLPLG
jgi:hypothetical protein